MFFFFLIIFLGFFINLNYISYDEGFLLNFCFFLFFFILYISLKRKFKIFNILKILKKYTILLMLFRINLNCNNLLKFFLTVFKKKFNKFLMKLRFVKYYIINILLNKFNNYNSLISILFLFYAWNINKLRENFVSYSSFIISKINFYDNLLCN